MFNKRKEKKAAEQQDAIRQQRRVEENLQAALENAASLKDPGEKILRLQEVADKVGAEESDIARKNQNKTRKAGTGIAGGGMLGMVASFGVGFAVFPPAVIVAAPIALGGLALATKRSNDETKKVEAASQPHADKVKAIRDEAFKLMTETATTNVETLPKSPHAEEALAITLVADAFAKAAAAKMAAGGPLAPVAVEDVIEEKKSPAARHQLSTSSADFDEIINIGTYNPKKKAPKGPKA